MVGSTKDPADGKAVAGSVFAAVVVYAVCIPFGPLEIRGPLRLPMEIYKTSHHADIAALCRSSSSSAASRHIYTYGKVREGRYH